MEKVNEYLARVSRREQIVCDLDTSLMSEIDDRENTTAAKSSNNIQSSKPFTPKDEDIPEIDAIGHESRMRSPLRSVNKLPSSLIQDSPAPTSPLKSKFAKLSSDYDRYQVDIKPGKTKEDYIQGPVKRVSMGPERSAPQFFAPKLSSSPANDVPLTNQPPAMSSVIKSSTPRSSALPAGSIALSPVFNHDVSLASGVNDTFDSSINGIFTFGKKIEITVEREVVYTPEVEPCQPISPACESKPEMRTLATSTSPLPQVNASSSLHSVKASSSHESIASTKSFGQNVNAIRKKFDIPNAPLPEEKAIDNSHTNFRKARGLFEKSAWQNKAGQYASPYAAKREQAVTNIRRYDDPNPTKKPAQCEIVTGPGFAESRNYWQNRVQENPGDLMDTAMNIFKKREGSGFNRGSSNTIYTSRENISPSLKHFGMEDKPQSAMEEVHKLVNFDDETEKEEDHVADEDNHETSYHTAVNSSWAENFKVKPMVLNESFDADTVATSRKASESHPSAISLTVPSDSFDYQKSPLEQPKTSSPSGPSLLDSINQDFTKIHTPKATKNNAPGTPTKGGLVHRLSSYRKAEAVASPHPEKIFSEKKDSIKELMSPAKKPGQEMIRHLSKEYSQRRLKDIEYCQTVINDQIQQAEKALMVARQRNVKSYKFEQEVELLQKLATLQERRRALYLELGRLSNTDDLHYIFPRARVRFTKISVDLFRHLEVAAHHYCYVFALIRYNDQVISTRAVFINEAICRGVGMVEFTDFMELENVSPDFQVSVEIYGLTIIRKDTASEKRFTIKRIVSTPVQEKRHHSQEVFARIGQAVIQREDLKTNSSIDLTPFETPLAGHLRINAICQVSDPDDNRWAGFLSIYRVVDGKGAWDLSYANIFNNRLNFWKYPEDVDTKPPSLSLNIRDMVAPCHVVSDHHIGFQYDFEMKILDSNEEVVRIMLSTAEEKDRERAISAINRSLKYINTWIN